MQTTDQNHDQHHAPGASSQSAVSAEKLPGVLLIQGWDLDKTSMPEFKVRLKLEGEPEETATYLVIGIDPINVFRDVEYKQSSQTM